VILAAGVLALATFAAGCSGDDTERMARIGRKTMARCDDLTAGLRTKVSAGIDAVRTSLPAAPPAPRTAAPPPSLPPPSTPAASVPTTPIDSRVLWRIRWDKSLAGADVAVETPSGGVVRLRGVVNDLTRQRRALELAETTEGVERVVNELGLKQP
jgi:hypothetical protein